MEREKVIIKTSVLTIIANFILAGFKAIIGFASNSIAIITDAVNNLSDAISSVITIIGTKFASKRADKEHPLGHGRIEYITASIISAIVIYAGISALIESIKKIITPEEVSYSIATIIIIVVAIIVKLFLGIYVKRIGNKLKSSALVASGADAFNDAILSISVLVSTIIYIIFKVDIDSYVGAILAVIIIKSGLDMIKESADSMIGIRINGDLSKKIKKEINEIDGVQGAYDLIITDYGPNRYLGSVHVEVPNTFTATQIDNLSRKISKVVYKKFGVILHTVGIYSINPEDKEIRDDVNNIIFSHQGIIQTHGFYIDKEDKYINIDVVMDFEVKDRDELYSEILKELKEKYKGYKINMTLDTDISD